MPGITSNHKKIAGAVILAVTVVAFQNCSAIKTALFITAPDKAYAMAIGSQPGADTGGPHERDDDDNGRDGGSNLSDRDLQAMVEGMAEARLSLEEAKARGTFTQYAEARGFKMDVGSPPQGATPDAKRDAMLGELEKSAIGRALQGAYDINPDGTAMLKQLRIGP